MKAISEFSSSGPWCMSGSLRLVSSEIELLSSRNVQDQDHRSRLTSGERVPWNSRMTALIRKTDRSSCQENMRDHITFFKSRKSDLIDSGLQFFALGNFSGNFPILDICESRNLKYARLIHWIASSGSRRRMSIDNEECPDGDQCSPFFRSLQPIQYAVFSKPGSLQLLGQKSLLSWSVLILLFYHRLVVSQFSGP
jgi:hypothetical protein